MLRILFSIQFLFIVLISNSQEISQVKFTNGSNLTAYSFTTDQKIVIRISVDGKILEWGNLWDMGYYNYYPGKLQPYMGRVEYNSIEADSINNGKIKSIGTSYITWYGSSEVDTRAGKIKSIGRTELDYYSIYDNETSVGKLKSAGNTHFTYYGSFENDVVKGKLKSVGFNQISYYTTFDDKALQGKIKSIGHVNYNWYNSNDRKGFQGSLKSGAVEQVIGGINFIIQ